MTFMIGDRLHVTVPATSANLGPGFDSMGLAIGLQDTIEVTFREDKRVCFFLEGFENQELPTGETNLIAKVIFAVCKKFSFPVPGLNIFGKHIIPQSRGLGSSAAAIVTGVLIASALLEQKHSLEKDELFQFAYELEGHPDNVAPALFGGLTLSWTQDNRVMCKKMQIHPEIYPVVCVPDYQMGTHVARGLLPEYVSHKDAVFNLSHAALLVASLTDDPNLLFTATEDVLHQPYRLQAMPQTLKLLELLRQKRFPAVASGAGPSVLVLCHGLGQRDDVVALCAQNAQEWNMYINDVDLYGASLRVEKGGGVFSTPSSSV